MVTRKHPTQSVDGILTNLPPRLWLRVLGVAGVFGAIAVGMTVWQVARCGIVPPLWEACTGKDCLQVVMFENRCSAR